MAFLPVMGAVMGIAGTLFSGASALGQGNYQAQVARNNAKIAERNAGLASVEAQQKQLRSDREYAAQRGMFNAQASASGLDVLGASQTAARGLIERNRAIAGQDLRRQGELDVAGFESQAAAFRGQANSARMQGLSSMIGSVFEAGAMGFDTFGKGALGSTRRKR